MMTTAMMMMMIIIIIMWFVLWMSYTQRQDATYEIHSGSYLTGTVRSTVEETGKGA
jgi:hypothetical protein